MWYIEARLRDLPDVNFFDYLSRLIGHELKELAPRDAAIGTRPVPGALAKIIVGLDVGDAVGLGGNKVHLPLYHDEMPNLRQKAKLRELAQLVKA